MKRLIAHISGNIKELGYCSIVVTLAGTLDLKGYIEILPDGKAFIIAEGPKDDLARFVRAIRIDNEKIKAKEIMIDCREPTGEFHDFHEILPLQKEQIKPFEQDTEMMTYNFLQAPDKMEMVYPEICTPNYKLKWAGYGLERPVDAIELSKEETAILKKDRTLPKTARKAILK